jgi:CheY-like chemotaxis protein
MMPELSGPTLAGYLQQLGAMHGVPIIFFSAIDEEKLHELAGKAGVRYVPKADGLAMLHEAILSAAPRPGG